MGSVFLSILEGYGKSWLPAECIVQEVFDKGFDVVQENNSEGVTKFVLFKDSTDKWRVSTVSVTSSSFEFRLGLPEELRGLRDEELSQKSGVAGCIFIPAAGFIGGANSEEGVLQLNENVIGKEISLVSDEH